MNYSASASTRLHGDISQKAAIDILGTWERKVLRKIYGPVYDNEIWRIRTNKELMALYQELRHSRRD
jgi:hypothetical protein